MLHLLIHLSSRFFIMISNPRRLAEFCARRRKKSLIIFSKDMRLGKNTARPSNVQIQRIARICALQMAAFPAFLNALHSKRRESTLGARELDPAPLVMNMKSCPLCTISEKMILRPTAKSSRGVLTHYHRVRRARPLARRRASTLRPLRVAMRLRKPCSLERWRFLG